MSVYFLSFLTGLGETLILSVASLALGLLFGAIFTLILCSKNSVLRQSCKLVLYLIRGLPEMFLLFFVYFCGQQLISYIFSSEMELESFLACVLSLGLVFGGYAANIFYSALTHISVGELEAAKTIKLSRFQIWREIILPQLWYRSLSGMGNLWLMMLKDTALISLIGGRDLLSRTQAIVRNTEQPFTYYFIVSLIYLLLTKSSEIGIEFLKKKKEKVYV